MSAIDQDYGLSSLLLTQGRDGGSDSNTPPEDNSTDNDLGDGKSSTNNDGSYNETGISDSEYPFTADSVGERTPD
jgi:hypothetical protein